MVGGKTAQSKIAALPPDSRREHNQRLFAARQQVAGEGTKPSAPASAPQPFPAKPVSLLVAALKEPEAGPSGSPVARSTSILAAAVIPQSASGASPGSRPCRGGRSTAVVSPHAGTATSPLAWPTMTHHSPSRGHLPTPQDMHEVTGGQPAHTPMPPALSGPQDNPPGLQAPEQAAGRLWDLPPPPTAQQAPSGFTALMADLRSDSEFPSAMVAEAMTLQWAGGDATSAPSMQLLMPRFSMDGSTMAPSSHAAAPSRQVLAPPPPTYWGGPSTQLAGSSSPHRQQFPEMIHSPSPQPTYDGGRRTADSPRRSGSLDLLPRAPPLDLHGHVPNTNNTMTPTIAPEMVTDLIQHLAVVANCGLPQPSYYQHHPDSGGMSQRRNNDYRLVGTLTSQDTRPMLDSSALQGPLHGVSPMMMSHPHGGPMGKGRGVGAVSKHYMAACDASGGSGSAGADVHQLHTSDPGQSSDSGFLPQQHSPAKRSIQGFRPAQGSRPAEVHGPPRTVEEQRLEEVLVELGKSASGNPDQLARMQAFVKETAEAGAWRVHTRGSNQMLYDHRSRLGEALLRGHGAMEKLEAHPLPQDLAQAAEKFDAFVDSIAHHPALLAAYRKALGRILDARFVVLEGFFLTVGQLARGMLAAEPAAREHAGAYVVLNHAEGGRFSSRMGGMDSTEQLLLDRATDIQVLVRQQCLGAHEPWLVEPTQTSLESILQAMLHSEYGAFARLLNGVARAGVVAGCPPCPRSLSCAALASALRACLAKGSLGAGIQAPALYSSDTDKLDRGAPAQDVLRQALGEGATFCPGVPMRALVTTEPRSYPELTGYRGPLRAEEINRMPARALGPMLLLPLGEAGGPLADKDAWLTVCSGVNSENLVVSGPLTCTPQHVEDVLMGSANILMAGQAKLWEVLSEGQQFSDNLLGRGASPEHANRVLIKQEFGTFTDSGFAAVSIVQQPGTTVITLPGHTWHHTTSAGTSLAIALNWGTPPESVKDFYQAARAKRIGTRWTDSARRIDKVHRFGLFSVPKPVVPEPSTLTAVGNKRRRQPTGTGEKVPASNGPLPLPAAAGPVNGRAAPSGQQQRATPQQAAPAQQAGPSRPVAQPTSHHHAATTAQQPKRVTAPATAPAAAAGGAPQNQTGMWFSTGAGNQMYVAPDVQQVLQDALKAVRGVPLPEMPTVPLVVKKPMGRPPKVRPAGAKAAGRPPGVKSQALPPPATEAAVKVGRVGGKRQADGGAPRGRPPKKLRESSAAQLSLDVTAGGATKTRQGGDGSEQAASGGHVEKHPVPRPVAAAAPLPAAAPAEPVKIKRGPGRPRKIRPEETAAQQAQPAAGVQAPVAAVQHRATGQGGDRGTGAARGRAGGPGGEFQQPRMKREAWAMARLSGLIIDPDAQGRATRQAVAQAKGSPAISPLPARALSPAQHAPAPAPAPGQPAPKRRGRPPGSGKKKGVAALGPVPQPSAGINLLIAAGGRKQEMAYGALHRAHVAKSGMFSGKSGMFSHMSQHIPINDEAQSKRPKVN